LDLETWAGWLRENAALIPFSCPC